MEDERMTLKPFTILFQYYKVIKGKRNANNILSITNCD